MKQQTDDLIYTELMDGINDAPDYFAGSVIELKEITDDQMKDIEDSQDEKAKENLEKSAGLENIISTFNNKLNTPNAFEDIAGDEGIGRRIKNGLDALIQFIKDIGRMIYNFFNNKIERMDSKIKYTEQKRKLDGVKSKEIKYPSSIRRIMITNKVSTNPNWVFDCVKELYALQRSVNDSRVILKRLIRISDENPKERVREAIKSVIGAFKASMAADNLYTSQLYPGNKVVTILNTESLAKNQRLIYISDSSLFVNLKTPTFTTSSYLTDESLNILNEIQSSIKKDQKDVSTLHRNFEQEVKTLYNKNDNVTDGNRAFLTWLVDFHKQLTSSTLQYTFHVMEALLDFAKAGIND